MINPLTEQSEIEQREEYRKQMFDEFLKSDYYDPMSSDVTRDFSRYLSDKIYDMENK